MSKQNYPNSVFPLTGDVESTTSASEVTVTGIQETPVSPQPPLNGQLLIFDEPTLQYVPGDPIVSGPDAPGTNPTVNPVQVAGIDEGNLVRELRTDTYGSLRALPLESLVAILILELRANTAATLADKPYPDTDFVAKNFTDQQIGA